MRRNFTPLLLIILLLTACRPAAPAAALAAAPTQPQALSPAPTEAVRVVVTVIQPPTWTPTPALPTRSPEPTETALPTGAPQPTATATPPAMSLLNVSSAQSGVGSGRSPDGKWLWTVDSTTHPGEKSSFTYRKTRFARADGSVTWTVRPELSQLGADPMGEIVYYPIFWQPGDPFVYLAAQKCCYDAPGIYYQTGFNLVRLNLITGAVAVQVPGLDIHDFAFSANGEYLADIAHSGPVLRITHLVDGEMREINLSKGYSQNGGAVFSPDNRRAVVLSCIRYGPEARNCERYALLLVDMKYMRASELVPDLQAALGSLLPGQFSLPNLSWADATHIHLDFPSSTKIKSAWRIDAKTGRVNKVTQ